MKNLLILLSLIFAFNSFSAELSEANYKELHKRAQALQDIQDCYDEVDLQYDADEKNGIEELKEECVYEIK